MNAVERLTPIEIDRIRDVQPYWIYKQSNLALQPIIQELFTVPYGFWYHVETITAIWPEWDSQGMVTFAPEIDIEFVRHGVSVRPQNNPVPIRLLTSPNHVGVIDYGAALGITSPPLTAKKQLNVLLPHNDTIEWDLTGQTAAAGPRIIDLCIQGYLLPERNLDYWKQKKNL